jgi:hypothetical protein
MKIKFTIILTVILSLLSCSSWAKENKINTTSPKITASIPKTSATADIPDFEPTDLTKVFAQAEKYYKEGQAWKKLKCQPKTGFICTKWECAKRDTKTFLILDKNDKTISRCEEGICDKYPAEFERTGVFFSVQSKGPISTFVRVLGDSRYKEITTIGMDAYVANGNCESITDDTKSD